MDPLLGWVSYTNRDESKTDLGILRLLDGQVQWKAVTLSLEKSISPKTTYNNGRLDGLKGKLRRCSYANRQRRKGIAA